MDLNLIDLKWEGPFSVDEIQKFNSSEDFGIYQIYGIHNINGPDSLLYIGQANDQTFATRILQHSDWIGWDFQEYSIYLGRFGSSDTKDRNPERWRNYINFSESLLINFCCPAWNTQHINNIRDDIDNKTILFNWGKRHKLPFEISTLYRQSDLECNRDKWQCFSV
jgi:hypothetical protein